MIIPPGGALTPPIPPPEEPFTPEEPEVFVTDGDAQDPPTPPMTDPPETDDPQLPERDSGITIENGQIPHVERIEDMDVPRIGGTLPLFPPPGVAAWALMNLILACLGVIFATGGTIRAMLLKRRQHSTAEHEDAESGDTHNGEAIWKHPLSEEDTEDNALEKRKKRRIKTFLTVAITTGIIGVFLFLLTQDVRNPVVLIDRWTIAHAVLFITETVSLCKLNKKQFIAANMKART